jgi:hypothetical protein
MVRMGIKICIFTNKASYLINLVTLHSTESKKFNNTKIDEVDQVWNKKFNSSRVLKVFAYVQDLV